MNDNTKVSIGNQNSLVKILLNVLRFLQSLSKPSFQQRCKGVYGYPMEALFTNVQSNIFSKAIIILEVNAQENKWRVQSVKIELQ